MIKFILFLLCFIILNSCIQFQEVEFKNMEDVKIEKVEGRKISMLLSVKLFNPNVFSIKIKPSNVNLYIEDQLVGKINLNNKVKIIKRTENTYFVPLQIDMEEGALLKFLKYSFKEKIKIHIKGVVKGSVFGITKKIEVDEIQEIDGKLFKLGSFIGK